MLILPVGARFDWRRPPVVTLLIVLVNVALHALTGDLDREAFRGAFDHYLRAGLPAIELPRYVAYVREQGDTAQANRYEAALKRGDRTAVRVLYEMESDAGFMADLRAGRIVRPGEPVFERWRAARAEFDQRLKERRNRRYGFVAAEPSAFTAFTSAFLHGDWGHLAGNMVVLVIAGVIVEQVLGWWRYALGYALAVFGAAGVHALFEWGSTVPVVGASGAVSGVVGMYLAIFGLRRIRFLYFAFVYFDYVRAPAALVLLLWLANEILQQYLSPGRVAHAAHVGGFMVGFAYVMALKAMRTARIEAYLARDDAAQRAPGEYDAAMRLAGELRFEEAADRLDRLADAHPSDRELALQAYAIASHAPATAAYHRAALRIMELPAGNRASLEQAADVFREYMDRAQPGPRLPAGTAAMLAQRFATGGLLADAERIAAAMAEHAGDRPDLAAGLVALADAYRIAGNVSRADYWSRFVAERTSSERRS